MIPSVSSEAEQELSEGTLYYAQESSADLGFAFIAEFERALDLLCAHPRLGAVWKRDRRRFSLHRFPYSIIDYIKGDELRVIALAHHRRRPGYWAGRK